VNWIRVTYPLQRSVFAEGKRLGNTNKLLFVGEDATLRLHLGMPIDYKPKSVTRRVAGTSRSRPLELVFDPS
jgi:hypothetical protein